MVRLLVHIGLLILLLESTNAAVLLGSKRCTWGPSYWCAHLGTMKECKSSGYCSRLWQRESPAVGGPPADSSEDCGFCRLLASDLERLARANRTSEDARRLATSACGLVPESRHRSLCLAVVENYADEAIQLLREGLGADRLCAVLSLCGAGRRDPKLHIAMETVATPQRPRPAIARVALGKSPSPLVAVSRLNSGVCALCVDFVTVVKLAAESKQAEAEVTQLVKAALCSRLGTEQQAMCDLWVASLVPEVMRKLADKTNPNQVCAIAKFCPAAPAGRFQRHPLMQLMILQKSSQKPLRGVECQVCEMLVTEARQMLRDNKTQDEIVQFLKDRVCGLIPAEKDKCIQAVTEYAPIIFQLLASELDPNAICQALGACGKTAAAASLRRLPRLGPQCLLCEYVIRELDQVLGSNRTEAAIQSALERVCSVMPLTVRQDCDAWVRQYTPAVLQVLSQGLDPGLVCTVLGLCAGQPANRVVSSPVSAGPCDVCQTVILYVKSLLQENATDAEVAGMLEKVCNFLPASEQPACRAFVDQYTPYIIQLLLQDVDPKQICQTLGLCSQPAAPAGRLHYRAGTGPVRISRIDDPLV